jgi:hypothetical protein
MFKNIVKISNLILRFKVDTAFLNKEEQTVPPKSIKKIEVWFNALDAFLKKWA